MQNVLRLDQGARPWAPSSDAQLGKVLDEYDVPLTGLLHSNGRTFLFTNILGDATPTGLWAYSAVNDEEIFRLLGAAEPDVFDEAVEAALANRCVTIAAAFDYSLAEWSTFDSGAEGIDGLTERFIKRLNLKQEETERGLSALHRERHAVPAG